MSEKKNIDKLFKEQFKDFEETPRDIVWERIENELHKDKKKRRIIPIWWKVAGVAAVLALLFTISGVIGDNVDNNPTEQKVVETESSNKNSEGNIQKDQSNDVINAPNGTSSEDIENSSVADQNNSLKTIQEEEQDALKLTSEKGNSNNAVVSTIENNRQNTVANTNTDKLRSNQTSKNKDLNKQNLKQKNNITTSSSTKTEVANTENRSKSDNNVNTNFQKKEQSEIDKLIKETTQSNETQVTSSTSSEKNEVTSAIDTTSTVNELIKEENAIENAIAEANKEDEKKTEEEEEASKRWSVAPNVAPVYFNSLGKGSSLDNQFVDNSKEGNVTMSYGVKGSYAIGKKLKIRAGINKVDLGYSTNNVLVFDDVSTNPTARQMQNVDVSNTQANSTYVSANTLSFGNGPEILKAKEHASIEQQLGFIEVPIELEYSLVDNKIGLNLIGGFSTLFLNNNEVYSVENNGNRIRMGEATNIKDMSYSANLGIGVNYNISKQLRFNLEPTFKYQINTFSNTAGDFQPYFIGVYTGLSFKF